MVFLNYTAMQMTAKIVYYGPGLCGKTTNLHWIHGKTAQRSRGDMVSLETEADRTLFFDLLPLDIGVIGGMKVRLQLYTVPGQVFYNATRRLVLKGVDGVVFVADSQLPAAEPNEESLANLRQNLEELGVEPKSVPLVFQYNKRDLRNILPVDKLQQMLNPAGAPAFEAAAVHGVGVFETLKEISRVSLASIRSKIAEQKRSGVAGIERRVPAAPSKAAGAPPASGAGSGSTGSGSTGSGAPASAGAASPTAAPAATADKTPTDPSLLEPLQVEFAEEDTDKLQVRAVKMRGSVDLGQELEKLRAMTTDAKLKNASTAVRDREVDKLFKEIDPAAKDADQEVARQVSLDVPEHLLRGLTDLRIHLGFDRSGREEIQRDAVRITLVRTRKLQRLRLMLDLELKSKE
jgi:signal recognition particle receptor subunit beta